MVVTKCQQIACNVGCMTQSNGNPSTPIMLRKIHLKIMEVLGKYSIHLTLLLTFHMGMDGFKMLGAEVLDTEKLQHPRDAADMT